MNHSLSNSDYMLLQSDSSWLYEMSGSLPVIKLSQDFINGLWDISYASENHRRSVSPPTEEIMISDYPVGRVIG